MRTEVFPIQWLAAMQMSAGKVLEAIRRVGMVSRDVVAGHCQVVHDADVVAKIGMRGENGVRSNLGNSLSYLVFYFQAAQARQGSKLDQTPFSTPAQRRRIQWTV